jgi:hypothetical protein
MKRAASATILSGCCRSWAIDPIESILRSETVKHVQREPESVRKQTYHRQGILQTCPDAEWRLIIALSRCGGIRVPSELLPMTWADVNWEQGRF